jgi:hypothetical protein
MWQVARMLDFLFQQIGAQARQTRYTLIDFRAAGHGAIEKPCALNDDGQSHQEQQGHQVQGAAG